MTQDTRPCEYDSSQRPGWHKAQNVGLDAERNTLRMERARRRSGKSIVTEDREIERLFGEKIEGGHQRGLLSRGHNKIDRSSMIWQRSAEIATWEGAREGYSEGKDWELTQFGEGAGGRGRGPSVEGRWDGKREEGIFAKREGAGIVLKHETLAYEPSVPIHSGKTLVGTSS